MGLIPDEARVLPPPSLVNRGSLYFGFLGYLSSLLHNAINQYPVLRAGVHRQILFTTIGVFVGYHLTKYENYKYAKRDRELFDYIRRHPEILPQKATANRYGSSRNTNVNFAIVNGTVRGVAKSGGPEDTRTMAEVYEKFYPVR